MSNEKPDDRAERLTKELLDHFVWVARYWARLPDVDPATGREQTVESRCLGVVFSMLSTLDGCGSFPPFNLVVENAPEGDDYDHEYDGVVISDVLHERMPA